MESVSILTALRCAAKHSSAAEPTEKAGKRALIMEDTFASSATQTPVISPAPQSVVSRVAQGGAATFPAHNNPELPDETEYCEYSVLLFGGLQETAGAPIVILQIAKSGDGENGVTVEHLRDVCANKFPQLARWMPYIAVAVNREYSQGQTRVFAGDEIAFLPPVAGGSQVESESDANFPRAAITETVLDENALRAALERESAGGAGAIVMFVGVVRDNARDNEGVKREVEALEYSAYHPMALGALEKIVDEVRARYDAACLVHHRVGRLEIGEASVIIGVACAHRDAAFEGCRFAIEALKHDVPIWKKEFARDGSYWVAGPPREYSPATTEADFAAEAMR